jgi:hypothetical protein
MQKGIGSRAVVLRSANPRTFRKNWFSSDSYSTPWLFPGAPSSSHDMSPQRRPAKPALSAASTPSFKHPEHALTIEISVDEVRGVFRQQQQAPLNIAPGTSTPRAASADRKRSWGSSSKRTSQGLALDIPLSRASRAEPLVGWQYLFGALRAPRGPLCRSQRVQK